MIKRGADEERKNFNEELPKDRLDVWRKLNEHKTSSGRGSRRISFMQAGHMVQLERRFAAAAMDATHRKPKAVHYSKACSLATRGRAERLRTHLEKMENLLAQEKEEDAAEAAIVATGGVALLKLKAQKKRGKVGRSVGGSGGQSVVCSFRWSVVPVGRKLFLGVCLFASLFPFVRACCAVMWRH